MANMDLVLKCSMVYKGVELGSKETSINSDILDYTRERDFWLEHSFNKVIQPAIQDAIKNYDLMQKNNGK